MSNESKCECVTWVEGEYRYGHVIERVGGAPPIVAIGGHRAAVVGCAKCHGTGKPIRLIDSEVRDLAARARSFARANGVDEETDTINSLAREWDAFGTKSGRGWLAGLIEGGETHPEGGRWNTPQQRADWFAMDSGGHITVPPSLIARTTAFVERERGKRNTETNTLRAPSARTTTECVCVRTRPASSGDAIGDVSNFGSTWITGFTTDRRAAITANPGCPTCRGTGKWEQSGITVRMNRPVYAPDKATTVTQPFNADTAKSAIAAVERERDLWREDARRYACNADHHEKRADEAQQQLGVIRAALGIGDETFIVDAIRNLQDTPPRIPTPADWNALDAHLVAIARGDESMIRMVDDAREAVKNARGKVEGCTGLGALMEAGRLVLSACGVPMQPVSGIDGVEGRDVRLASDSTEEPSW